MPHFNPYLFVQFQLALPLQVFKRSAAGNTEQSDPEHVRPPRVLCGVVDYLVTHILDLDAEGAFYLIRVSFSVYTPMRLQDRGLAIVG